VQVSAGWLGAFIRAFEDPTVGIAGGPSIPAFTGSVPLWLWDFLQPTPYGGWSCGWLSLLDIGKTVEGIDPIWIWGLNFAIRKDVLCQLGGFHPDLVPAAVQRWQGDGETGLAYRAKASGVRCVYLEDALLHHLISADRLTPDYFAKRAYYQGVCDSFTRIRAGTPPVAAPQGPRPAPREPGEGATSWARAAYEVKTRAAASYNEGWSFHQKEAAGDPQLLLWIRRPDYWTADIRDEIARRGAT
jgi:glucosyl-dolichyl phosphate glucuronosyltransferase